MPGDLGLGRAYVQGDLQLEGSQPGNPYGLVKMILNHVYIERPTPSEALRIVRGLGGSHLKPPRPARATAEMASYPRRCAHSRIRDKAAIQHHYDV